MAYYDPDLGKRDIDLLLIGKTGHGKSATGNSILARPAFNVSDNSDSFTSDIEVGWSRRLGRKVKVVDGPGVDQDTAAQMVVDSMTQAMALCSQGFHALLLVVKYGNRFTDEEINVVRFLKSMFGQQFVKNHCILVFTHGENFALQNRRRQTPITFEDWCSQQTGDLQKLLQECNYRAVLFHNLDEQQTIPQLETLFRFVDGFGGARYTTLPTRDIYLLLIGQAGYDKSSTGNSILGQLAFDVSDGVDDAQVGWARRLGREVKVVDGPSVGNNLFDQDTEALGLVESMREAMSLSPDGYHAVILILKYKKTPAEEDINIVNFLKFVFGQHFVRNHCILVFTHGEIFDMENRRRETPITFEDWCNQQTGDLQKLLQECNYRAVLFNNLDEQQTIPQLETLFRFVDGFGGARYTNLPTRDIDLLLIGQAGCDRSSTRNSILGQLDFDVLDDVDDAQVGWARRLGREVKVVDIPGVGNNFFDQDTEALGLVESMKEAMSLSPDGYHAVILILKSDRFTEEDMNVVKILKFFFGQQFVKNHCILVFPQGENFAMRETPITFENWCKQQTGDLQNLLQELNYRAVLLNIEDGGQAIPQLETLFRMVDGLGGVRFSNDSFCAQ